MSVSEGRVRRADGWSVLSGDCLQLFPSVVDGAVALVCADPPWGIEWPGYATCLDDVVGEAYVEWCSEWMQHVYRALTANGSFWLAIGPEYVSELDVLAKQLGFHKRGQIVQYTTFGVACTKNFSRSHSYWLYYTKHKKNFVFNASDPMLRIPSARQIKYNDKRANPKGKLPDATWVLHPDELKKCCLPGEDVWLSSRLAGTFKERVYRGTYGSEKTCPQMPLAVMDRIILASSNVGDLVLDPFAGTGSTGVSAVSLDRRFTGFEIYEGYCKQIAERLRLPRTVD